MNLYLRFAELGTIKIFNVSRDPSIEKRQPTTNVVDPDPDPCCDPDMDLRAWKLTKINK
jgi:hypothetical protein